MDTQQGRAVFPTGTQQAEVCAGLSDSELSVLPSSMGNCPPPRQGVPWYWLLKEALRTWGPSLFSELSLLLGSRWCAWCLKGIPSSCRETPGK